MRIRRSTTWSVLAAGVLVAAAYWWYSAPPAQPQVGSGACRGCNFLLITIDTLRRDRVGAFGGAGNLTPNIDRFASEGIRLERAYASAPLTLPSHTSIMTGVDPPVHGVRTNGLFRLGTALPTLATMLRAAGYRTGAFVGAFVLDARFGLNRGFDEYDDRYGEKHATDVTEGAERRAEDVVKPASAWILAHAAPGTAHPAPDTAHPAPSTPHPTPAKPWFAWVHLYDPHEPYDPPPEYASGHAPYDGEVAYADAMVGRLLDDLKSAGQLERTLVMIAADHGESLGEHGERTHGVFVYDATMRVPWIVWAGTRLGRGSFDGLARLVDLTPTALDLLGIPPQGAFDGRSLLRAVRGEEPPPATAYLEAMDANLTRNWAPLTAIVNGTARVGFEKLVDLPEPELYDLRSDPAEATNRFERDPERARMLTTLLRAEIAHFGNAPAGAQKVVLNAESRQRLQALGYVATSVDPRQRVYTSSDDPKRLIAVSNELNQAIADFNQGSRQAAMSTVARIISEHPSFSTAYGVFGSMQHDIGDLSGAIGTLDRMVERGLADQSVMVVLAGYLQEAGDLNKAAGVLDAVTVSHPDYAEAWNSLGVVLSREGRHDGARGAFSKLLALDPTSATAYENLGVDEIARGNLATATTDLQRALELDPKLANARNALASVYLREHRLDDAVSEWRRALDLNPRLYDALYNLGTTLWDAGRRDEARPYLERFVAAAPPRYAGDVGRIRTLLASGT